jgi:hypothetical protein
MFFTVSIKNHGYGADYLAVFNSKDEALNAALNLLDKHAAQGDMYIDDGEVVPDEEEKIFVGGPYKEGTNLIFQTCPREL